MGLVVQVQALRYLDPGGGYDNQVEDFSEDTLDHLLRFPKLLYLIRARKRKTYIEDAVSKKHSLHPELEAKNSRKEGNKKREEYFRDLFEKAKAEDAQKIHKSLCLMSLNQINPKYNLTPETHSRSVAPFRTRREGYGILYEENPG